MHPEFFTAHTLHPYLLLVGLALFPRITMLFVGGPFGVLQWLGWAFMPHFTVAMFATFRYWDTNPGLVVAAWLFAFAGTSAEGRVTTTSGKKYRVRFRRRG